MRNRGVNETILLVDDNPKLLAGAQLALSMNGFQVLTAKNGIEAIEKLSSNRPSLIVSDITMPGCDGFTLLERVHAAPEWVTIPFLFLTAMNDPETVNRSRKLAVDDFLTKPFSPGTLVQAVTARLERARALALEMAHSMEASLQAITILANAIETRDPFTSGHAQRVGDFAECLARSMGLPTEEVCRIRLAAILHDIGKISIPEAVLNKPISLTKEEWEIVKTHPMRGVEILAPLNYPQTVLEGVCRHHERYDGQGYPDGLAGDQIPLAGRLVAVADAYDSMTIPRAYRGRLTQSAALERLHDGAGTQFDPWLTAVFIEMQQRSDGPEGKEG
jgi:putative two-component system response regulator